jgi:predicted helicase
MKPLNLKSWTEFFNHFCSLDLNNKQRGTDFEKFCQAFYKETALYKNAWLLNEVPFEIKKVLGWTSEQDLGVDLVLENHQGELSAVQCKFHEDQNQSIVKKEVDPLLNWGKKAAYRILFTTSKKMGRNAIEAIKDSAGFGFIGWHDLNNICENRLSNILKRLSNRPVKIIKKFTRKTHQIIAIKKIVEAFKSADKGQLVMACGTGKSLTALWVAEDLKAKRVLYLVPSLGLVRQTKDVWNDQKRGKNQPHLYVCSAKDISDSPSTGANYSQETDNPIDVDQEIGAPVTTDVAEVIRFLTEYNSGVVFCTYQSFPIIEKALEISEKSFDLTFFDEAHKTAGKKNGTLFSRSLNTSLQLGKRLFMTATPKMLSKSIKKDMEELGLDPSEISSGMDDSYVYGKTLHQLSCKESIEEKLIADFRGVIPVVTDNRIEEMIGHKKYIELKGRAINMETIVNSIFLEREMGIYNATHAVTFHSDTKKAENFSQYHKEISGFNGDIYFIEGRMSMSRRKDIMKAFEKSPIAILCNCRVMTEGIDVPDIDLIMFCDPKSSVSDIVQATGRALRKPENNPNKMATVVVPVYDYDKDNLEETISKSKFKHIAYTLNALRNMSGALNVEINKLRIGDKISGFSPDTSSRRLIIDTLLDQGEHLPDNIKEVIFDRLIGVSRLIDQEWKHRKWMDYKVTTGHRPPQKYKDPSSGWCMGYYDKHIVVNKTGSSKIVEDAVKWPTIEQYNQGKRYPMNIEDL